MRKLILIIFIQNFGLNFGQTWSDFGCQPFEDVECHPRFNIENVKLFHYLTTLAMLLLMKFYGDLK